MTRVPMPGAEVELVGRASELAQLRGGLAAAAAGAGRPILIAGEPGIGKTRLATELAAEAARQGATVLWGRCWEDRGAPAYWPWIQVVRTVADGCDAHTLATWLQLCPRVVQLVPELRARVPDLPAVAEPSNLPAAPLESERFRFELFDAVTTFLREAARVRPMVVILDDLHAADLPSLLLLRFLARVQPAARLLAIGTYRQPEARRDQPTAEVLSDVARLGLQIELRGLSESETGLLIERTLGTSPRAELVSAVYATTEGNPLFVDEVVRASAGNGEIESWTTSGPARSLPGPIPDTIRVTVGQRFALLSPQQRELLLAAAVIGRDFPLVLLQRLSRRDMGAVTEQLEVARTLGFVSRAVTSPATGSFAHGLIREALCALLPPLERSDLHRRIAADMEDLYAGSTDEYVSELAHHHLAALPQGDALRAIDYCKRAGERSRDTYAYEEAAAYFQHALEALELVGGDVRQSRCELLLLLGEMQTNAGNNEAGEAAFERAAELARSLGDSLSQARAAMGFAGRVSRVPDGSSDEKVVRMLEEAAEIVPEEAGWLRAWLMARLAVELYYTPQRERREQLAATAVDLARAADDPRSEALTLSAQHFVLWGTVHPREQIAIGTRVLEIGESLGDLEFMLQGRWWRVLDLLAATDFAAAKVEFASARRLARELHQPHYLGFVQAIDAGIAVTEGHFADAEGTVQQALAHFGPNGGSTARRLWATLLLVRKEQGRLGEIEGALSGFAEQFSTIPMFRAMLAFHCGETGRFEEARAQLDRLARDDFAEIPVDVNRLPTLAYAAEAAAFLGDRPRAAILYELLAPHCGPNDVFLLMLLGTTSHALGVLAAIIERWEDAQRHFEAALATAARMGARPALTRSKWRYAEALLRRGYPADRERALALLGEAQAAADALGMQTVAEAIRVLALQSGTGPTEVPERNPRDTRTAAAGKEGTNVFRKQGEYWNLVFDQKACSLKDLKGFSYIALLLRHPGREFHAVELITQIHRTTPPPATAGRDDALSLDGGDAGDILDPQARAAYRARLRELQEELAEAEDFNDRGRMENRRNEIEALNHELGRAFGLGGRARKARSIVERTRVSVTKALRNALEHIAANHPQLGAHLRATIRTGVFCSYRPDPRLPPDWQP